ncbi:MAG: hypothetical protein M1301_05395 [Candidatus Thermoplasmatota archaeon]|jgi:hypothetical protein|nr:hypothetical protein [Candidatus Thermoplasmatota archaeon]
MSGRTIAGILLVAFGIVAIISIFLPWWFITGSIPAFPGHGSSTFLYPFYTVPSSSSSIPVYFPVSGTLALISGLLIVAGGIQAIATGKAATYSAIGGSIGVASVLIFIVGLYHMNLQDGGNPIYGTASEVLIRINWGVSYGFFLVVITSVAAITLGLYRISR